MKKVFMSLAIAALTIASVQGQENKTVKKESTVERVVTKEGSNVSVKEIKNTTTESGTVIVEGNDKTNQAFNESSTKGKNSEIVVDEVNVDQKNEALVRQQKDKLISDLEASKRQQEELEASKRQQEKLEASKRQQEELEASKRQQKKLEASKRQQKKLEASKRQQEEAAAQKKQFLQKSRSKLRREFPKDNQN